MLERNRAQSQSCSHKVYLCLYILDCLLNLFVIPICIVVTWASIDYIVNRLDNYLKIILIIVCVAVHSLSHLCCKFIYRFIKLHVTSPKCFFIISKLYLYIFGFASIVLYGVVPEKNLSELPDSDNFYQNVAFVIIPFIILCALKCRPNLADISGSEVGRETTAEEVFLFPYRLFNFSVSGLRL